MACVMARLTNSSVSPSEGTFQVLCLAVTSLVVMISLYIDFDICFLRYCVRWNQISASEKKRGGGGWRLLVLHLSLPHKKRFCPELLQPWLQLPEGCGMARLRWSSTST